MATDFTPSRYGAGLGLGAGNIIGNIFNNPADQYEEGMQPGIDKVNQAVNTSVGYLNPWREKGMNALNDYMDMVSKYKNPSKMYEDIMGGWQMSRGTQDQLKGAMDTLSNTMASRGLMGSGQEMKDLGRTYEDYASRDQQQYLNNILGIGQTGLTGFGNASQWGQSAANKSGDFQMQGAGDIASMYNAVAAARAAQSAKENTDNSDFLGGVGSFIGGKMGWL